MVGAGTIYNASTTMEVNKNISKLEIIEDDYAFIRLSIHTR